jgi:hypothetical protein
VSVQGPESLKSALSYNVLGYIEFVAQPSTAGKYKFTVIVAGETVPGSPFEIVVEAGPICAKFTEAFGDGIQTAECGTPAGVTVWAKV